MDKLYTIRYKNANEVTTTHETETDFFKLDIVEKDNRYTVTLIPKRTFEIVDFIVDTFMTCMNVVVECSV